MSNSRNQRITPRKWTPEEEEILLDEIGRNPINLRMCFIAASIKIHRTPNACASHWYAYLSQSNEVAKTGLITIGRHIAVRNKKRFKRGMRMERVPQGVFRHLLTLLFDSQETI